MRRIKTNIRNSIGMTLIEVLVTIFILGLIFAFSYQSISTIINTREIVPKEITKYSDLERVFDRIEYDFINASTISPVSPTGYKLYPIMISKDGSNGSLAELTISRFASGEYQNQDGNLIGYRLNQQTLEILFWPKLFLSTVDEVAKPKAYPLLSDIKSFNLWVKKTANQNWSNVYPNVNLDLNSIQEINKSKSNTKIEPLPVGLKIEIEVQNMPGKYTRVVNRLF